MSDSAFNHGCLPIRSLSSVSVISDAHHKAQDRRVCHGYMLDFDSPMLIMRVGTGNALATFLVHETLFTSRSEFLQRATTRNDHETDMRMLAVALPNEDPNTFHLYLNLVYANQLVTKGTEQWLKLCQLYVLAEKLQDVTSKNDIIDGMHIFFNELVQKNRLSVDTQSMLPAAATAMLYEGTPYGCQARKLIVDLYANFADENWLSYEEGELPNEFIHDVAVRVLRKRARIFFGSDISRPSSHYHEVSTSFLRTSDMVTGNATEASINERSDVPKAVTVA